MTIQLSDDLEKLIKEKVQAGVYSSAEDMIRAGIEQLLQNEKFEPGELEAMLAIGQAQLDRGEGRPAAEVFERLRRKSEAFRRVNRP